MSERPGASGTTRSIGKSPAAFRTITEVAAVLEVPQHVLRFWETKFPQVKPLKRGGGRRYYRPEDVATLEQIRRLLYAEGYTIRGAQKMLLERGRDRPAGPGEKAPPGRDIVGADPGGTEPAAEAEATAPVQRRREAERWQEVRDILAELEAIRSMLPGGTDR